MLASTLTYTAEVTLVHLLGPGWPATVQLFWRQAVGLLLLMPIVLSDPAGALKTSRPGLLLFRSVAAMMALLLSIYAFSHMPIATANALAFTRPLFIVVFAAFLLKERVDLRRALAMVFGFAGVLVMVRPGDTAGVDYLAVGAILGSALLFAASFVSIKTMTGDGRTTTIMFYGMLLGLAITAVPAWLGWRTPTLREGLCLAGLGVTSVCNFAFLAKAMRRADASAVVGLDYLRLPLTVVSGYLLFGETLSSTVAIGGLMIVVAALMVTLRKKPATAK